MNRRLLCGVAFLLLIMARTGFGLPAEIVIGRAGDSQDTLIAYKILEVAYAKLDVKAVDAPMPALRSLVELENGRIDAEAQRVDTLKHRYKNIVQVPIQINFITAAGFSWKRDISIRTWEALNAYKIGIVRGIRFADIGTQHHPDRNLFPNYNSLFKSLAKQRIDIAIAPKMNGFMEIATLKAHDQLHLVAKNLQVIPLFHYLSTKKKEFYEPIYGVLQDMQANGELEKIRKEVLVKYYKMPDAYFDK